MLLQAKAETDAAKLPLLQERLKKLRGEYDGRHDYWTRELPEGKIRTLMPEQSYKPAVDFYEVAEKQYLPALMAGNHALAEKLLDDSLAQQAEGLKRLVGKFRI